MPDSLPVTASLVGEDSARRMVMLRVEGSGALASGDPDRAWFVPDSANVTLTPNRRGVYRVYLHGFRQRPADGNRPARLLKDRRGRAFELDDLHGSKYVPAAVRAAVKTSTAR